MKPIASTATAATTDAVVSYSFTRVSIPSFLIRISRASLGGGAYSDVLMEIDHNTGQVLVSSGSVHCRTAKSARFLLLQALPMDNGPKTTAPVRRGVSKEAKSPK